MDNKILSDTFEDELHELFDELAHLAEVEQKFIDALEKREEKILAFIEEGTQESLGKAIDEMDAIEEEELQELICSV